MSPLDQFYAKNHILAKSVARKLYRHIKVSAIELLEAECKQAKGGRKGTIRKMIEVLKREL